MSLENDKVKKAKYYSYIDHSFRPTKRAYILASSKTHAAEIIGRPLSFVSKYLSEITGDLPEGCNNLEFGVMAYASESKAPAGISLLDLERIAALGYLKTAKMSLHQCELNADEKDRLATIIGLIDDLRGDVSDRLEKKYKGR